MKMKNTNSGIKKERQTEMIWCYLFLALPIIGFLVLQIYPIIWTFRWSFYSYYGVSETAIWTGINNFKTFFTQDFSYWIAWKNTLRFMIMKVPVELTLAMLLALALTKGRRGSGFFRSMFYVPNVISVAIIGVVFSNLFSYYGIINCILQKFGMINEGVEWFADKNKAMLVVVIGSIWNTFGINVMYLMAALTSVPEDIYESAELDGASAFTKFFKITFPMILPLAQIVILMSVVGTLSVNDYIVVLTNGGPSGGTNTVMSYLTTKFVPGFADTSNPPIGYGCAMSLVTTILFLIIAVVYNKVDKKLKNIY